MKSKEEKAKERQETQERIQFAFKFLKEVKGKLKKAKIIYEEGPNTQIIKRETSKCNFMVIKLQSNQNAFYCTEGSGFHKFHRESRIPKEPHLSLLAEIENMIERKF